MTENSLNATDPVAETITLLNSLTESQLEEVGRALNNDTATRLQRKSLNPTTGGLRRRTAGLGVLLTVGALLGIGWAYFNSTKNIASGERNTKEADWGYAVDQYRFRNRMRLNLWSDSSLFSSSSNATLDLSNVSVNKITEERWLADSRAIYLNMLVTVDGKEQPAKVIYDFQRGEMQTTSPADLWRVPNEPNKDVKLKDEEFQAVLNRYTGQTPALPLPTVTATPTLTPGLTPSANATLSPASSTSPAPNK